MKICILSVDFYPNTGGIARYGLELARALIRRGNNVSAITRRHGSDTPKNEQVSGINIYRARYRRWKIIGVLLYVFSSWLKLRSLAKNGVDVSHALIWLPDGLVSLLGLKFLSIPYYVTIHAAEIVLNSRGIKGAILKQLMRMILSNARAIIAVSDFTRDKIRNYGINVDRIVVIPNGTDPFKFNTNMDYAEIITKHNLSGKRVILTTGRLVERKGHDMVIKAIPQVIQKIPNAIYLIVGGGEELSRLKELVSNLRIQQHVIFTGFVSEEELPKYYNACDVFIMPSREITSKGDAEGFGIVYLEANACGKPVIGGRSGGISSAIVEGVTGLLVNPLNVEEISNSLVQLLHDKDLALKLGNNGRCRVEEELNWDSIASKINKEYLRVSANKDNSSL